jgi:hypothetical protein
MDAYLDADEECPRPRAPEDIPAFPFPIEPVDIVVARIQVASRIGQLPFGPRETCSRSLWVVFAGYWGVWIRGVIPVDSQLDRGDPAIIGPACDRAADLLVEPECYDIAIAAVVLRRPAPDTPSRADRQVFRLLHKSAATRDTVPWSFFVTGPEGPRLLVTKAERERYRY